MHEHWRQHKAEHKPVRHSRDHPPALRLRHPKTGLLEPLTLLRPSPQHQTGRGLGQALPSPRRVPGHRSAGRSDPGPGHCRSTGRRPQTAGGRHTAPRTPDRGLGSDPWGTGDLHRPKARPVAHRPAGRLQAWLAQHVPACDVGSAARAYFDFSLDLFDAMPALGEESLHWPVTAPVSRYLRPYPDESA
jgi:hypothetical protein